MIGALRLKYRQLFVVLFQVVNALPCQVVVLQDLSTLFVTRLHNIDEL